MMTNRVHICAVDALPPGKRQLVKIGNTVAILVLNVDGVVFAINNECAHEGASLEHGMARGGVLYCPLHQWGFVLTSGVAMNDPAYCAQIYIVETDDNQLYLCLP